VQLVQPRARRSDNIAVVRPNADGGGGAHLGLTEGDRGAELGDGVGRVTGGGQRFAQALVGVGRVKLGWARRSTRRVVLWVLSSAA
jgi:hypothetical protein